ncbi:hypothetical protein Q9233_008732 [Columba guinea]|nr:hypothetical protein Q9233_008732 [Columba guinea]
MKGRKKGCSLPLMFILLFICITGHATTDLEDGEEEDVLGAAFPPLKLGHSVCAMKADEGPCKAIHMRYYFNIQSRECEIFEYGGCHGNENNFLTLEECEKTCVVTGQVMARAGVHIILSNTLIMFFNYNACNPQNLKTLTGCTNKPGLPRKMMLANIKKEKPNFCFHEKDPGICRGYFSRYFYNKETNICEVFKYGGCLGNQNNFKNLEECQTTCQGNSNLLPVVPAEEHPNTVNSSSPAEEPHQPPGISKPPPIPSLCMTPMDRGLCRAKELRFFYNYSTGRCHPFSYSGCGGNENNFTSRKSCLRICKKGMGSDTVTDCRFNKKKGERRLIKIKKTRKKQPVKALGDEIMPERIQL